MAQEIDFVFSDEFKKCYQKLPAAIQKELDKQLKFFASNLHHPSLKIHRLNDDWEFYVDIHYRCFFNGKVTKYTF